ncbi:hypothetical protein F543_19010 [Bibersteinia trehalosi USDA-ARS-USMARC-189]|uniref:Uncharacterized protein n=1 Tax=Bibersteinia trehalosi USDA-ARS-USMARC-189 TaxID=1263831 RepID=A0ABM5PFW9_BIBTR|nr:hypothetical protein F543_19010 [Bibersteinia trehalosi USDA-ARS-USMARC-189]
MIKRLYFTTFTFTKKASGRILQIFCQIQPLEKPKNINLRSLIAPHIR